MSKNDADMKKKNPQMIIQPPVEDVGASIANDYFSQKCPPQTIKKSAFDEIEYIFSMLDSNDSKHIDGKMLSNMSKIVFFLALKKSEVLNLKICDVVNQSGEVNNEIQVGSNRVAISDNVKQLIIDQLELLKNNDNYGIQVDAFLFQDRNGKQYTESARQLRKMFSIPKAFQILRDAGIIFYHSSLSKRNSEEQRIELTRKFACLDTSKQVQAVINEHKIPAGIKTGIEERLNEIWNYTQKIIRINELFKGYLEDLKNTSNELITSINTNKKISDDLKSVLIKGTSKIFSINKIGINGDNGSISISSHKNISYSMMINKIAIKDRKYETYVKLLWLIDHAVIFPISDIDEVDRYKDLFLKTLSTLSYYDDLQENQNFKKSIMNSFADTFFKRNIVFNERSGAVYIWEKKKENKDKTITLTGLIQQPFKDIISGRLDENLLSLLKKSSNDELKQLVAYLRAYGKITNSYFEDAVQYFDDYLSNVDNICKYIQQYQCDENCMRVERLAPYIEVVRFVADNLKVNYDKSQDIDIIEFQILVKILEYSWNNFDNGMKEVFLKGILDAEIIESYFSSFPQNEILSTIKQGIKGPYKISLVIANAIAKLESGRGLTIHREPNFIQWVQLFEDAIFKGFEEIYKSFVDIKTNIFDTINLCCPYINVKAVTKKTFDTI